MVVARLKRRRRRVLPGRGARRARLRGRRQSRKSPWIIGLVAVGVAVVVGAVVAAGASSPQRPAQQAIGQLPQSSAVLSTVTGSVTNDRADSDVSDMSAFASSGSAAAAMTAQLPVAVASPSPTIAKSPGHAPTGSAVGLLATLPVKGRAPGTGYSRSEFGPAWSDDNDDAWRPQRLRHSQ